MAALWLQKIKKAMTMKSEVFKNDWVSSSFQHYMVDCKTEKEEKSYLHNETQN